MKSAIVPAQITTVEDRIAGNLTLQQMILLITPVFVDFMVYAIFPRPMKLLTYKLILMILIAVTCSLLAIRVRGKILLLWIITIARYNLRPRYYVFNKNDSYLRYIETPEATLLEKQIETIEEAEKVTLPRLSTLELVQLEDIVASPEANLHFKLRKGVLHATVTEIDWENVF